jgi:hypothetical protein
MTSTWYPHDAVSHLKKHGGHGFQNPIAPRRRTKKNEKSTLSDGLRLWIVRRNSIKGRATLPFLKSRLTQILLCRRSRCAIAKFIFHASQIYKFCYGRDKICENRLGFAIMVFPGVFESFVFREFREAEVLAQYMHLE